MNILRTSLDWLEENRKNHISEYVELRCPGSVGIQIKATQTRVSGEVIRDGVKMTWQQVTWMMSKEDLDNKQISPIQGMMVVCQGFTYQVAFTKAGHWEFNDPFHKQVVIRTNYIGKE